MDQDRKFFDTFMFIIGALMLFTVFIFWLANHIANANLDVNNTEQPLALAATDARIAPVGTVLTTDDKAPEAVVAATAGEEKAAMSGDAVYQQACFACHGTGAAGAPKLGDKAAWAARIAQGMAVLNEHAIKGFTGEFGMMPPKGGRMDLSDAEVMAAVDYMVSQSK